MRKFKMGEDLSCGHRADTGPGGWWWGILVWASHQHLSQKTQPLLNKHLGCVLPVQGLPPAHAGSGCMQGNSLAPR